MEIHDQMWMTVLAVVAEKFANILSSKLSHECFIMLDYSEWKKV